MSSQFFLLFSLEHFFFSACSQTSAVPAATRSMQLLAYWQALVSNRVVTGSDEELLIVDMQQLRYLVPIRSTQVLVMCNKEYAGTSTTRAACCPCRRAGGLVLVAWTIPGSWLGWSLGLEAAAAADGTTGCSNKIESNATGSQFSIILTIFPLPAAILAASM